VIEQSDGGAPDHVAINPAFAAMLESERDSLNQRFALRQRAGAKIDGPAFEHHLRTTVNELVSGVAQLLPERSRAVTNALFDISLDLFSAGLLGTTVKHSHVNRAWREVLPRVALLLARDPRRVAGCLSNAVDHLASFPAARPDEWIEIMGDLSPHCESVPNWLDAGKIVAWRAGLVQYREAALRLAKQLPWQLATRCVGTPTETTESDWHSRLDRLESDRWFSPSAHELTNGKPALSVVRTIGGFRGFGGPCQALPRVTASNGALFVSDGLSHWELRADVFGTLWHRIPTPVPRPSSAPMQQNIAIDSRGHVVWGEAKHQFPELADANSYASDGQTLAVTLPTSFHVFLVASTFS
jgi:hypothetical protein